MASVTADFRVFLLTLFYNNCIFLFSVVVFLYLRRLRGDSRERGAPLIFPTERYGWDAATERSRGFSQDGHSQSEGSGPCLSGDEQLGDLDTLRSKKPRNVIHQVDANFILSQIEEEPEEQEANGALVKLATNGLSEKLTENSPKPKAEADKKILQSPEDAIAEEAPREELGHTPGTTGAIADAPSPFLNWFWDLLSVEDDQFQSIYIQYYLLFLRRLRRLALILTVIGCAVLLPVNLSATSLEKKRDWLDRAAGGSLSPLDWRIWVLYGTTWIFSVVVYYEVYRFWIDITQLSEKMVAYRFRPEKFTILVKGIAKDMVNSEYLFDHFKVQFPGQVIWASIVLNYVELRKAKQALNRFSCRGSRRNHKRLTLTYTRDDGDDMVTGRSQQLRGSQVGFSERHPSGANESYKRHVQGGYGVPSLSHDHSSSRTLHQLPTSTSSPMAERLSGVSDSPEGAALRTALANHPGESVGLGFVCFRDAACVLWCLRDPRVVREHYKWEISAAPVPTDILWLNIHYTDKERACRSLAFNTLLVVFSIVITSSAVLTNSLIPLGENIEKAVKDASFFKLSVTGWGAPLILFLVNSVVLPQLINWKTHMTHYWRVSVRDLSILHGNAIFLILNTVIFPTLENGSVGALLKRMYNTEIERWNISLGRLIIGHSGSFALRYLLNGCFLTSAAQLLQLGQASYFGLLSTFGHSSVEPWRFEFGYSYAFCVSIYFIMMAFGVVVPLSLPLATLVFFFKYYIDKYNLLYGVLVVKQESGGKVAAIALRYMLGGVALFQFIMSGYFVALGLQLSGDSSVTRTLLEQEPIAPTSHAFNARCLVLGGTFIFLTSVTTVVLLTGNHIMRLTRDLRPPDPTDMEAMEEEKQALMTTLNPAREYELVKAYTHPYQKEIEQYLHYRTIR